MRVPANRTRLTFAIVIGIFLLAVTTHAQEVAPPTVVRPPPVVRPAPNTAQLRHAISRAPSTTFDLSRAARPGGLSPPPMQPVEPASNSVPALKLGHARFRSLPADVEDDTRKLILQRVPQLEQNQSSNTPVTVLKGAVEMLSEESKPLTLRMLAIEDAPLRFNGERRVYEGSLSLGVVELEPSGRTYKLSAPITFEVLGVVAMPKTLSASTTAPPFETVAVEVDNPGLTVDARIRSILDPNEEAVLTMAVERPKLAVTISPEQIQGWGLEKASVLVRAEQVTRGDFVVQVASQLGRFDSNTVSLDENGMGNAMLRSESTGQDRVTVSGLPFENVVKEVEFVFPMRYILAALLGGIAGGLLRFGNKRRRGMQIVRDVILAVIAGAIVFGLFVLGVNVTGFGLPAQAGEVLVFVVAALGAFAGTRLLSPKS